MLLWTAVVSGWLDVLPSLKRQQMHIYIVIVPISYLTSWIILEFLYLDGSPSWHATATSETLLQHLFIFYAEQETGIRLQFEPESAETSTGIYASTHLSNNCILLVGSRGLYLETPQLEGSLSLSKPATWRVGSLKCPSPISFPSICWIFHDIPIFMPCIDRGPRSPRGPSSHLDGFSLFILPQILRTISTPLTRVAWAPRNQWPELPQIWAEPSRNRGCWWVP